MAARTFAFASAALFAVTGAVSASDTGWYVGIGSGLNFQSDVTAKTVSGGKTIDTANLGFDPTWRGAANFGYAFDLHLRLEGEVGYTHPVFDGASAAWMQVDRADFRVVNAGVNVLYDYPLSRNWYLTAGLGAGYGWTRVASVNAFEFNEGTMMGQAVVGATYRLTNTIDVQFDYRYVATQAVTYRDAGGAGIDQKLGWAGSHNLMFTLRLYFDNAPRAAYRPAPAPVPPPPVRQTRAQPVMPAPVTTYIVYFGFNEAVLTADARAIVARAVKTAVDHGFVKVLIRGHTDTVGAERYNVHLSVDRARAVKAEMVRDGINGAAIAVLGVGYLDPAVATGPGVREPQNRRAVIDLNR